MSETKEILCVCPDCDGDGIETCHNPDHGFLNMADGVFLNANESACPCCGHSSDHKISRYNTKIGQREYGKCESCLGSGIVTEAEAIRILDDYLNIDKEIIYKEETL